MTSSVRLRLLKPLFVLAVVLGLSAGLVAPHAFAQVQVSPSITVQGATADAVCDLNGAIVPAGERGTPFNLLLENFAPTTGVALNITFPDGRVYLFDEAMALAPGVYLPVVVPTPLPIPATGQLEVPAPVPGPLFGVNSSWPAGCYTFTAAGVLGEVATTQYVLLQPELPLAVGPATLQVVSAGTTQPVGVQGGAAIISGRGFQPLTAIAFNVIQPDGTSFVPPIAVTNAKGNLAPTILPMPITRQVGLYTIVATEAPGASAVPYVAIANYVLNPIPQPAVGGATARITAPAVPIVAKGASSNFTVAGSSFEPSAGLIDVSLVLPNGAIISAVPLLGIPPIGAVGGDVAATLTADPRLPTGTHIVVLSQTVAGNVLNRASTAINLVAP